MFDPELDYDSSHGDEITDYDHNTEQYGVYYD